ncbi:MAG TPA: serine/threonine-protein kinase [Planctomycetota bacterium]|nr:serine/threonine-protein kinase [Planctomycetota bacterium]
MNRSLTLAPGTRLHHYRIVALVGAGGMGAVYRAHDEALDREVALKVLLPGNMDDPLHRQRFLREARAAAAVVHPHVAIVHFVSEVQGFPFIVSELVAGGSLAARQARELRIPWREAARLGGQIARGLDAIHAAGIVHRDLKPANVLVDGHGDAKVTDFGLARVESVEKLTKTGELMGTPAFMSPEQANGTGVDPRADLYSLGALVFALVAGRPPFDGAGFEILNDLMNKKAPALSSLVPEVPRELDALVARLLAKEPQKRGKDAALVASELEAIASPQTSAAPAARGPALPLAVGAALVLGTGCALLGWRSSTLAQERDALLRARADAGTHPSSPEPAKKEKTEDEAAELLEDAWNMDPFALQKDAKSSATLRDGASRALEKEAASASPDAQRVRAARRRLVRARLLLPADPWPKAANDLEALGRSRDRLVATVARPWLEPGEDEPPRNPVAAQWVALAAARREKGTAPEALLEALVRSPREPLLWERAADAFEKTGRYVEAALAWGALHDVTPDFRYLVWAGKDAMRAGYPKTAESLMTLAMEAGDTDSWTRLERAKCLAMLGDPRGALGTLDDLEAKDHGWNNNEGYWFTRAWVARALPGEPSTDAWLDRGRALAKEKER